MPGIEASNTADDLLEGLPGNCRCAIAGCWCLLGPIPPPPPLDNLENSCAFSDPTLINVTCAPLGSRTDPAYESCAIKFQSSLLDERVYYKERVHGEGRRERNTTCRLPLSKTRT